MSQLIKANYDKLLVALAAAVLAVSGGWMGLHQAEITRLQRQPVAVDLAGYQTLHAHCAYRYFSLRSIGSHVVGSDYQVDVATCFAAHKQSELAGAEHLGFRGPRRQ